LKLYLRELPEPLLTSALYEQFIEAQEGEEEEILSKEKELIMVIYKLIIQWTPKTILLYNLDAP
jgi:hypothetical protein